MNIVKLKNIKLDTSSGLTEKQCELFNSKFSGKYVHAIDWTFCVPIEDITNEEVIRISRELCCYNNSNNTLQRSIETSLQSSLYSIAPNEGSWKICTSLPSDLSKYEFLITYCSGDTSGAVVAGFNEGSAYLSTTKTGVVFSGDKTEGGTIVINNKNIVVGGKYSTLITPSDSMVFKIKSKGIAENKYYIYHEGSNSYLGNDGSGNVLFTAYDKDLDPNYLHTLNFLTGALSGVVNITCRDESKNTLMYNTSSPRMKWYASSSASSSMRTDLTLYMRLAETPKEEPVLYFDNEEVKTYLNDKTITNPIYNPFEVSLTYTSTDESIATVDENGLVTLVGVGECDIICVSEESDIYASIETSYHLIVRPDKIDSEYYFTNPDSIISCNVGDSISNPAISPYDDINYSKVMYISDDPSVAEVDQEGNVTILKEGVAEIHFVGVDSELYKDVDIYYTIQSTYNPIKEYDWLEYDLLLPYVDVESTMEANNLDQYLIYNSIELDDDIVIEELKRFRTWLAESLLKMPISEDKINSMLNYYANEMNDDVCKQLLTFGSTDIQLTTLDTSCGCGAVSSYVTNKVSVVNNSITKHTCGCMDNSSLYQLGNVNICDPLSIYRKNVYAYMVQTFSNIDFWIKFRGVFIEEFKRYIDGIIRNNFTLTTSSYVSTYVDCGCLNERDIEQKNNVSILNSLSKTLEYIINDDINGHKNFISDTLYKWSSLLYEKMRW